jgi:NAD(P)H-hydrate repair Nnr-like enzyme with NAD(P)H-hydrate dehydratase domain
MHRLLRVPGATDDKYSRGVVGFVTGSEKFPGAALLGVTAALRVGIGMARYLGPDVVGRILIESRPEVVLGAGRAQAWVIGSGVEAGDARIQDALGFDGRKVIDAGALSIENLAKLTEADFITPHAGEAARLSDADLTELTRAVVVLKGNITRLCQRGREVVEVGPNPTDLATAGTGDVLAGILGALGAANPDADGMELAQLAVEIHSEAARRLALTGSIAALDLANEVREVVGEWRS